MDMEVVLFNFGGNTRVFHDWQKKPVVVDIGKAVPCRLDYATARFIAKASKTDTVVLMAKERKLPDELNEILNVLRGLDDQPYDVMLEAFHKIAGVNDDDRSPDRIVMRTVLSQRAAQLARAVVSGDHTAEDVARAITGDKPKTVIHDDVDPAKLRKDYDKQQQDGKPKGGPKPTEPVKKMDDAEASAVASAENAARERVNHEREIKAKRDVRAGREPIKRVRLTDPI